MHQTIVCAFPATGKIKRKHVCNVRQTAQTATTLMAAVLSASTATETCQTTVLATTCTSKTQIMHAKLVHQTVQLVLPTPSACNAIMLT